MPIAALSEDASRAIRSTLVLNDAVSVIKELVDNALDARASNILIEISANTLDVIQVKDNGIGVGVEDRQLLCKSGFTSKIRNLDDLAQLGGKFMGFRGEALASIAELSEQIAFVTRVDGETVGTRMTFDSTGKLKSSSSASHPTGTTVRLSQFLHAIPVRRQTALKQAIRTLTNIKKLLFDYAFARPTVKLQFRVLRSKSDLKDNWSFAPCNDASNLILLASKIVGKEVAAQCQQETITSADGHVKLDALLLKPDAVLSKGASNDFFVSLDGRPLSSASRNTRSLYKIYRAHLQRHARDMKHFASGPFLLLHLRCAPGSYDVNVEPAKNEVMFEDIELIRRIFDDLCTKVYGTGNGTAGPACDESREADADGQSRFDILLARKPAEASAAVVSHEQVVAPDHSPARSGEYSDGANTGDCCRNESVTTLVTARGGEDSVGPISPTRDSPNGDDAEDGLMDPRVTNPFVIAKLNARVAHSTKAVTRISPQVPSVVVATSSGKALPSQHSVSEEHNCEFAERTSIPWLSSSLESESPFQNPGPPNRPWRTRQQPSDHDTGSAEPLAKQNRPPDPTLLDKWRQEVKVGPSLWAPQSQVNVKQPEPLVTRRGQTDVTEQLHHPKQHPSSLESSIRIPQKKFRIPFERTPPEHQHAESHRLPSPSLTPVPVRGHYPDDKTKAATSAVVSQGTNERVPECIAAELADIMDFEHRKKHAVERFQTTMNERTQTSHAREQQRHKQYAKSQLPVNQTSRNALDRGRLPLPGSGDSTEDIPPQPNSSSYTQNPHWNRYRNAVRELDSRSNMLAKFEDHKLFSNLDRNDPRSYLLQLQASEVQQSMNLKKGSLLSKLPFETISPETATFATLAKPCMSLFANCLDLKSMALAIKPFDNYISHGVSVADQHGLSSDADAEVMAMAEAKVRNLCEGRSLDPRATAS